MAEIGSWEEAAEFALGRSKTRSAKQRIAWLQQVLDLAHKTGALERARQLKLENTWKYGKQ